MERERGRPSGKSSGRRQGVIYSRDKKVNDAERRKKVTGHTGLNLALAVKKAKKKNGGK